MAAERLQKLIAATGLCSRRRAEDLLRAGRVRVNGQRASLGDRADPSRDAIAIDGQPLAAAAAPCCCCSTNRWGCCAAVVIPMAGPRCSTCCRRSCSGARASTGGAPGCREPRRPAAHQPGELTLQLTHPRYGHTKTYRVWVAGQP